MNIQEQATFVSKTLSAWNPKTSDSQPRNSSRKEAEFKVTMLQKASYLSSGTDMSSASKKMDLLQSRNFPR